MVSAGAGQSSMHRFRQERRQTLRQHWREPVLLLGFIVATAVWLVLDGNEVRRPMASFLLGVAFALLVVGWLMGFDARSLRWVWGAAGETWTAAELARLDGGWRVFHDVRDARGNWDHIVVGPPGVFVVDSKNLREPARIDERGLRAGRLLHESSRARGSAVRLKELIAPEKDSKVWVQAVVAVWGELLGGCAERDRVLYVSGGELVPTLLDRRARHSADDVSRLAGAIEDIAERLA